MEEDDDDWYLFDESRFRHVLSYLAGINSLARASALAKIESWFESAERRAGWLRVELRAALAAGLGGGVEVAAAVREGLGLAQHVATLLGLDDRGEASDVVSRYVAPDELPEVLALRRWPGEPEEVAPPPPPPEEDAELALMMP